MATTEVTTPVTYEYLTRKSKHDLAIMYLRQLSVFDDADRLRAELGTVSERLMVAGTDCAGLRAELDTVRASLLDPAQVHAGMLRGTIAPIGWRLTCHLSGGVPNGEDAQLAEVVRLREELSQRDATIAELRGRAGAVPEGWRLVPAEPTEDMIEAGNTSRPYREDNGPDPDNTRMTWEAMLAAAPQPAQEAAQPVAGKWDGAEEWMPLAWQLCADECGEDACNELVWEGGPIPEPWGERWLKYEDEAKRLIALVRKHVPQPQPAADEPLTPVVADLPDEVVAALDDVHRHAPRAYDVLHGIATAYHDIVSQPAADQAARDAVDAARADERERMCVAIKAADDEASDNGYMLDSDDCIKVIRGTWNPRWLTNETKAADAAKGK